MSPRPVLQRDDPAMFPVSYFDIATSPPPSIASSSTTPVLAEPTPTPATRKPSSAIYTLDASTIIVLLSFLVFVLWVVAIFLFAPSLRQLFIEYRAKKRQEKLTKKRVQGLGFGYEGLTQAELQLLQKQEEEDGERSFMRVPHQPPLLSAIALLSPITIPTSRPGFDVSDARRDNIRAQELNADPAPAYERGGYHWPGSEVKPDRKAGGDGM
ncbi:hypothetical protein C8R46DRAFT_1043755 [Mycena filopes]|nr:hypothetical protein C8R46DRAFT_1043755 [Mycena filopes]